VTETQRKADVALDPAETLISSPSGHQQSNASCTVWDERAWQGRWLSFTHKKKVSV